MKKLQYFSESIKSLGHTPIYKMHKYFARRPHNVFSALIEHYTNKDDVIFDPFGGGGVSLIEGLTLDRKVFISDVNPVASFIQYCQVAEVDPAKIAKFLKSISDNVEILFPKSFKTCCTKCENHDAHVRWVEHAYIVKCPECNKPTSLSHESKFKNLDGDPVNGSYACENCNFNIKAANVKRTGSKILSLRFKCDSCGAHENKIPDKKDILQFSLFEDCYEELVKKHDLLVPQDKIPAEWDRQQEDCLHRKGFEKFSDLFTRRNLLICSAFFNEIRTLKKNNTINEIEHDFMFFVISSLLRYTNNMNFSTSSWMDGRPVAWAKHAYWTPNQYIEVNPYEYLQNRIKALRSGLKDQKARFTSKKFGFTFSDLQDGKADYVIKCQDSANVEIQDESVDLVVTDPPYGSNVQYGELCYFWQVWLQGQTFFPINKIDFSKEAVVHRKTKKNSYQKNFDDYRQLLEKVFSKCHRVLKKDGVIVFTFNNKDIRAWYAVIKAALDAGFHLEPEGIFYQEAIDAYRDTAHLRYDGTPQGDFLYTFKKSLSSKENDFDGDFNQCLKTTIDQFKKSNQITTAGDFWVRLYANSALCLVTQIRNGKTAEEVEEEFKKIPVDKVLRELSIVNDELEAA